MKNKLKAAIYFKGRYVGDTAEFENGKIYRGDFIVFDYGILFRNGSKIYQSGIKNWEFNL